MHAVLQQEDREPEELARRFWELFTRWDLDGVSGLVTDDLRWRGSLGSESTGIAAFLAYADAARQALPDLGVQLDEVAVSGSQAWARLTFSATHSGQLLGVPATGRRVSYVGQAVHDVRDGRLSRIWVVADTLSLHRQLTAAG